MTRILITGSTDGIGNYTALKLAEQGQQVIIHGRTQEKCKQAVDEILRQVPHASLETVCADFSELAQVKSLAEEIPQRFPDLQVLINNAGVFAPEYKESADQFELSWAVNYLAPVLLTEKLIDTLMKNPPARIINLSSVAHKRGRLDLNDPVMGKAGYNGYHAYSNSKLALTIYTNHLAKRLSAQSVTANSLHPGVISTKMLKTGFNMEGDSLAVGAETPLFLATADEVLGITGQYFDQKQAVPASNDASDTKIQEKLWRVTQNQLQGYL